MDTTIILTQVVICYHSLKRFKTIKGINLMTYFVLLKKSLMNVSQLIFILADKHEQIGEQMEIIFFDEFYGRQSGECWISAVHRVGLIIFM